MINETLKTWEREYGDVRHKENTDKLDKVYELINRVKGAVWTVGGVFTLIKIYEAMKK